MAKLQFKRRLIIYLPTRTSLDQSVQGPCQESDWLKKNTVSVYLTKKRQKFTLTCKSLYNRFKDLKRKANLYHSQFHYYSPLEHLYSSLHSMCVHKFHSLECCRVAEVVAEINVAFSVKL